MNADVRCVLLYSAICSGMEIIMKKLLTVVMVFCMVFLLMACGNAAVENEAVQGTETNDTRNTAEGETATDSAEDTAGNETATDNAEDTAGEAAENTAEENEGEGNAAEAESISGGMTTDYSAAVAAAISKEWDVEGKEEAYVFMTDGSGEHSLEGETEAFQYTCGFNEENDILVQITTGEREEVYQISNDETGYRIYMEAVDGGKEKKLLTPAGLKILDTEDEKVTGILGVWEDDGGNQYEFTKDSEFLILTAEDSNGTFSAAEKADGAQEVSISVAGGILRYTYSLQDDGETLQLYNADAESYYYWHRSE